MKKQLENFLFLSVRWTAIFMLVISTLGIYAGGWWSFAGFAVVFIYYFAVELVLLATGLGYASGKQAEFEYVHPSRPSFADKYGITFFAFSQVTCVPLCLWLLTNAASPLTVAGGILSLLFSCGTVGGLAGHDHIHRRGPAKWLGIAVFTTISYGHFLVSHTLGHHARVGLADDWSTARYGETLYRFLYRAVVHGYVGAWKLENARLARKRAKWLSTENQMLKVTLAQILFTGSVLAVGGWKMLAISLTVSAGAVFCLETVNYLSHYGLVREARADGRLEGMGDHHSWETDNKVTNWFVFNTGKHAHHHRQPAAESYKLRLADANPVISLGLPLMTIIALHPRSYFKLMDKELAKRAKVPVSFSGPRRVQDQDQRSASSNGCASFPTFAS